MFLFSPLSHFYGQIFDVVHFVGQIDPQDLARITALVDLGLLSLIGQRALQFLIGMSKKKRVMPSFLSHNSHEQHDID